MWTILLDEHVDPNLMHLLRASPYNYEVDRIGLSGCPATGSSDPQVLDWCIENGAILLTMDRRTMPLHLNHYLKCDVHVPGIIMLNRSATWHQIADDIHLLLSTFSEADLQN